MNIDEYESYPFKIPHSKYLKRNIYATRKRHDWHRIDGRSLKSIIVNVCKKYLGMHINNAFSYYCKLVPKYQQKFFWDSLDRDYYYYPYFIDENNIIVKYPHKKKYNFKFSFGSSSLNTFKSSNYKVGYYIKDNFGSFTRYESLSFHQRISLKRYNNIIRVVEEGFSIDLNKKSNWYKRLMKESSDSSRKQNRIDKKEKLEFEKTLLNKLIYNRKLKEVLENEIDRDRLGFTKDSFIGEGYHGKKRKKSEQFN